MAPQLGNSDPISTIKSDRKEIYYDGHLYDVTDFIPKHPGGTIINYYTEMSEDATIPIQQFHHRSIKQVLAKMKSFKKHPASLVDNLQPSESERHQKLTEDFQKLFQDFQDQGIFEPSLYHTFLRVLEVVAFLILGVYFYGYSDLHWAKPIGSIFSVIFLTRCSFLVHEGGHGSLTGSPKYDRFLEAILMNLGVGLSSTWWSSQHNRHHAMPQRVDRDVDLNTLPLIAFNSKIAFDSKIGNNFFTRHQAKLFFSIDTVLVILYWKLYLNPKYVLRKKQYGQILMILAHYAFFLSVFGLSTYLLFAWVSSMFIFGTFTLSHSHLPVTTEKLHWVEYSFLHTMNVNPSFWCDWAMGYLNYQVEHHLFPSMPNFRQRQISGQVKAYALKHGLPYQCVSYPSAIWMALQNLAHVSGEITNHKAN